MSILNKVEKCLSKDVPDNVCKLIFLRESISAENEAVDLYETIAAKTDDPEIEEVMSHVAEEEEKHVGEFQEVLYNKDPKYAENVSRGMKEVKERND